ncbi:MAG: hypothetical protein LBQ31_09330 [Bacteroidales bacterium]|jgi:hypothetical protein|nr:hypothetical protein [Bacteroidales bacterium]
MATSKNKKPLQSNKLEKPAVSQWLAYCILALVFVISFFYIFDTKLNLGGDNFDYLMLSRSFLGGHGYSSYAPGWPAASHFPPGYPFFLAIFSFIFRENIILFKVLNGLLLFGSAIFLYKIVCKLVKDSILGIFISTFVLISAGILSFATIIMSELPYMFFSILSIYCLLITPEKGFLKKASFYVCIISAIVAYYMRNIGIVLFGAVIIHCLFTKKWKLTVASAVGFIVGYVPWMIRNNIAGIHGSRYMKTMLVQNNWRPEEGTINTFSAFIEKTWVNFYDTTLSGFINVCFPFIKLGESKGIVVFFGIIVLLIILYGAFRIKPFRWFLLSYTLANIAVFIFWHTGNGTRYVWPFAPFIIFLFFYGVYDLLQTIFTKRAKFVRISMYIVMFFLLVPTSKTLVPLQKQAKQKSYPPSFNNYVSVAKHIKAMSEQEKGTPLVCCRKGSILSYYSGAFTCNYTFTSNDTILIRNLIKAAPNYVVIDQLGYSSTGLYLVPAVQKNPEIFLFVINTPEPTTYLLRFNREAAIKKYGEL